MEHEKERPCEIEKYRKKSLQRKEEKHEKEIWLSGNGSDLCSGRCSLDDPPRYSEARKKLSRKLGAALFNESVSRSEAVLSNGDIIKP